IKDKIIKNLQNKKLSSKEMKNLLKPILIKITNNDLHEIVQKGSGEKNLIEINNLNLDYTNYKIKNKRDLCKTNIKKEQCNSNLHCLWKSNTCKLQLTSEN